MCETTRSDWPYSMVVCARQTGLSTSENYYFSQTTSLNLNIMVCKLCVPVLIWKQPEDKER